MSSSSSSSASRHTRRSRQRLTNPTNVKLTSIQVNQASAVNTAFVLNAQELLNTTNFPELASWQGVYDCIRIKRVKLIYHAYMAASSTVSTNANFAAVALSFDSSAPNPTSALGLADQQYHRLLVLPTAGATPGGEEIRPSSITANSPAPLAPITSEDNPGSAWVVLDSSTAPVICSVLGYFPAQGAVGVSALIYGIELTVDFKTRA